MSLVDVAPTICATLGVELDHVRAGGMGMKSRTSEDNLVALCSDCHRWKTEHGRVARPDLIAAALALPA